jgi:hypothetical protein
LNIPRKISPETVLWVDLGYVWIQPIGALMCSVELHCQGKPAPVSESFSLPTLSQAEQYAAEILREPSRFVGLASAVIRKDSIFINRLPERGL